MPVNKEQVELDEKETVLGSRSEYIQYSMDIERTIRNVQEVGSFVLDPKEAALVVLKSATVFYDADWCGVIDTDVEMKLWTPIWWYDAQIGEMATLEFPERETNDCVERWIDCIRNHTPVVLLDIETVREEHPEEYMLYKNAGVQSLMAVPFWRSPMGFLVVKNPRRYKSYTSMLHLLNYTVITSLHEYKMMETLRHRTISPRITKEKDVYISMFGELKITTSKGVISETELKSPKIARLLVYLLLSRKAAIAPREIQDTIWPEEACDLPGKNIKGLVYRLQQAFNLISDYRLIESTSNGYRINSNLNIITDIQLFVDKCQLALSTASTRKKKELLYDAIALYEGDVLSSASSEHWLMPTVINYQCYYIGMFNELMRLFDADRNYEGIHTQAAKALLISPRNPDVYFWLIHAMAKRGHCEVAKSELKIAETKLLEEDYMDLKERLSADQCFISYNLAATVSITR